MQWRISDIEFADIDYDATDHPVATVVIKTPAGILEVMAEFHEVSTRELHLKGLHIQSPIGSNVIGIAALRCVVQAAMEYLEYDEIIVEGASRTTGASPGRTPRPVRFTRRLRAATRAETN
jgi:hypothetical protein